VKGQASVLRFSRSPLKCPNENRHYSACTCNQVVTSLEFLAHGDTRSDFPTLGRLSVNIPKN
jgi:hypothetical protein